MSLQFFIADDGVHGQELYVTDGTGTGTRLLKDINSGLGSSYVGNQVQSNGILYFTAYDGSATHLWRTDGTSAGTYALTSSTNGDNSGNLINVNGTLYFTGSDSVNGSGLFKSDGSVAGTTFVKAVGNPGLFTAVGSTLFFQAYDATNGYELWKSDGTAAGTGLVKDINPGTSNSSLGNFTASNGKLYFTDNDGSTGNELWVSDGTSTGTFQIKDINLGASGSNPSGLFAAGGYVYFFANDGVRTNFYSTNGTSGNATVLSVTSPVTASFVKFNNAFYFVANDSAGGQAIYTSNGSAVTKLAHLGSLGSVFYNLGSQLVFYGDDGTHGGGLYSFNGATTTFLSAVSGGFNQPVVSAGKLFFVSYDGTHGNELWVYDGTGVHITADVNPGIYDAGIANISAVQNGVVFTATRPDVGTELFFSDGTAAKTGLIDDVNATADHGPNLNIGSNFFGAGGLTYFSANDNVHGYELWAGDGTAGGSHQVADLVVGASSSNPSNFHSVGGTIYFTADIGDGNGRQLYTSDGTTETRLSNGSAVAGTPYTGDDAHFFVLNGTLYYQGYDSAGVSGYSLFKASPAGITKVAPGYLSSGTVLPFGSGVIFQGSDATHGIGLYTFDGTTLTFVAAVSDYESPAVSGGKLYYRSTDGNNGSELWVYDGTSPHLTADLNPGTYSSNPTNITGLGDGRAVFSATNSSNDSELYVSDGSTDSSKTKLLYDVNPTGNHGVSLSIGSPIIAAGNLGFFSANDGVHGYELWIGDGTAMGSRQVADKVVGAGSSSPSNFHSAGGTIYFTADLGDGNGRQLYTSDGTTITPLSTGGLPGAPYTGDDVHFFVLNDTLYYQGYDSAGVSGYSLFKASPAGITKVAPGYLQGGSILPFGSGVIFQGSDATHGTGLYTFDGTTPTFVAAVSDYESPAVSGGKLYFRSNDGNNGSELWVYDGTSVHLTADLNPGTYSSNPTNITGLGDGRAVFTATAANGDSELYVSDGSTDPSKTKLLDDVNPTGDRSPSLDIASQIVSSGGKAYFVADGGGLYGNELFVSDGSTTGTHIVKDIITGATGSNPTSLYAFSNKLFFLASDGSGTSRQLFATDGTSGNTIQLTFANNTTALSNASTTNQKWFTLGGKFYYVGNDPAGAYAIYTSDGTVNGTNKVVHLSTNPTGTAQLGGVEYFQGNDGSHGAGLYSFDGTTLTLVKAVSGQLISPIVAGGHLFYYNGTNLFATDGTAANSGVVDSSGSYSSSAGYAAPLANGKLVYQNYTSATGSEVYVSDGTVAGTAMLVDLMPGTDSSNPTFFTTVGSKVYFAANYTDTAGYHGRELFATDGTAAGTSVVKDINPGSGDSNPGNFFAFNGLLYFSADAGDGSGGQLYTSNGTDAGTQRFVVANADTGNPANFLAVGDGQHFYFTANNGLFYSNGTAGGTTLVGSTSGFDATKYAIVNGTLYYQSYDGTNGYELWKSNGTAAGTVRVSDTLLPNGSNESGFTFVNTAAGMRVFFSANDGTDGQELWVTDGTAAGTHLVKDMNVGSGDANPQNFFAFNGKLYFEAYDSTVGTYKLWSSDGTAANTQTIGTSDGSDDSYPGNFLVKDATHFFFTGNAGLFYSDGTTAGTTLVTGTRGFDASHYAIANGVLLFQKLDDANGYELWRSDGTATGTYRVSDTLLPNGSNESGFTFVNTAAGMRVFFSANDGTDGQELWVTDGTAGGTHLVKDMNVGSGDANPQNFFAFNGKLYFEAYDSTVGTYKLWSSDGTAANTQTIGTSDGSDDSYPGNLLARDATHFFFTGNAGLFYSDGTTAGTTLVTGTRGFNASNYAVSNGILFFQKSDGTNGTEQWRSDGTAAGTYRVTDTYTPNSSNPSSFAAIDNLPPTVTGTAQTAIGDNQTNHPFQNTVIADPDLPAQTMTVTITPDDPAKGGFTAASLSATGFVGGGVGGSYTYTGTAAQATAAIQALVYQPVANRLVVGQAETIGFTVAVNDGAGGSVVNTATTVTQTSINDAPVGTGDAAPVNEDATASVGARAAGVLGNDTDADVGETATLTVSGAHAGTTGADTAVAASGTTAIHGTYGDLLLAANGTYSYTPNTAAAEALPQGVQASEVFTYTVADVHGATGAATLTFTITGQEDAPVAVADGVAVNEDATASAATRALGLLGNDTDVDTGEQAALTVTGTHAGTSGSDTAVAATGTTGIAGTYGTLQLKADGTYSYTPNTAAAEALTQGTVVTEAFSYTIKDAQNVTSTSTVTVTVTGQNDAPVAGTNSAAVNEDATAAAATRSAGLLGNASDVDTGETATLTVRGAHAGASGSDIAVAASGATDIAGTYGTLHLGANGTYSYTPNSSVAEALAQGAMASEVFTYTVADVHGATATATLTFTITGQEDAPAAVADAVSVNEDATAAASTRALGLLGNDTDVDTGETATLVVTGAHAGTSGSDVAVAGTTDIAGTYGTLHLKADGTYGYTPNSSVAEALAQGATASDVFSYTIKDAQNVTSASTLTFTVTGQNDAPVANGNSIAVNEDATAAAATRSAGLLGNASDVDTGETATLMVSGAHAGTSGSDTAVAASGTTTIHGTYGDLSLAANGTYSYTPNGAAAEALAQGAAASEVFTYTVADVHGAAATATLTFAITGQEDAPVAVADGVAVNEDATATATTRALGLLGNDADVDSGETATLVVTGAHAGTSGSDTAVAASGTTDLAGIYGTLHLSADGTYSYTPNSPAAEALAQGATASDVFSYTIKDAQNVTSTSTLTFTVTGQDDPAIARPDAVATDEATVLHGSVLTDNGSGADYDIDGPALAVAAVNGTSASVGQTITLASGATLLLQANGQFAYDPNHKFDYLVSDTGAANASATDSFTYTLQNGGTATVTVTIAGISNPGDHAQGTAGNDTITATSNGGDYFDLSQGGDDTATGGAGGDAFYMGGALTAADHIDGGAGNDQVGLQGDYTGANALHLSATTLTNVETLALLPGGSTPHSYDITSNEATVAAGRVFTVFGGNLAAGENLTFDGSAEHDGSFIFYGGLGVDTLTGGAGNDAFYFGPDKFGASDQVHGGLGNDQLGLDGHSAALTLDSTHTDVETLALLKGPAYAAPDTYGTITVDDSWVAANQTKTITAITSFQSSVGPVSTALVIDGSHETNGNLNIYGGSANDTITGGAGADHIYGGLGADTLTGRAGADVFIYNSAAESTGTGFDTITDFTFGSDVLRIDGQGSDDYVEVTSGRLDASSFNADLQAAVGGQLASGHAVFFTATSGSFANQTFLVVDANGTAGYQSGGDYVIHVPAAPVNPTGPADFITH